MPLAEPRERARHSQNGGNETAGMGAPESDLGEYTGHAPLTEAAGTAATSDRFKMGAKGWEGDYPASHFLEII